MQVENLTPRVLVIEDEQALSEFFVLDLEAGGFQVVAVADGEEALTALNSQQFDAVVTDINLPKKSGIEIVEELRRHRDPTHPAIAVITGETRIKIEDAYQIGVNLFLEKPFKRQQLIDELKRLTLPPEKRWAREHVAPLCPAYQHVGKLELNIDNLAEAQSSGVFVLGNRGFFIGMSEEFPNVGETFDFDLVIGETPLKISGLCVVRWCRTVANKDGHSGCGAEILELKPDSAQRFLAMLEEHCPVAAIPRGP